MDTENIKTEWDLSLLYDSPEEDIEKDIEEAKEAYQAFADAYKDDDSYLKDAEALREALEELEYLGGKKNLGKPSYYYSYKQSLDVSDQEAESKLNQLSQFYSKLGNKIRFFQLKLGNITKEKQEEFLQADELEHYHKYLRWLFKTAEYNLDEKEENLLSRTSLPRNQMWVNGVDKTRSQKTVEWEGETLPISEARNKIEDLPTDKRRDLHQKCMNKLKEVKEFAESELNAVVTDKKITDEMRGYEKPYSATVLGNENTPEEVETLIGTVTENFDIAHRFHDLKAKLLEEDALKYADRNASVGSIGEEMPFTTVVDSVHEAFADMDNEFADVLRRYLQNGQIDVYPKENKQGGAFCSFNSYLPTFVLLNHVPNFKSVTTLAHEMGHAIHGELSKKQSPFYESPTTSTTETASTFFEGVIFNRFFERLDRQQKIIALHDKINNQISTVFRQVACFNFEKELHARIRDEGSLSHKQMAELMNKHMQAYLGERFDLDIDDGYYFVVWPHIRRFFYVYTYAYGNLISETLHAKYKENDSYLDDIKQFLQAGSRKSPQDIFANIGVDTTSADVFETGLASVREDIDTLENLIT
jgi:oligoendopeptidase F